MKKLLLFGGAFNPPHKGHARLLESAIEAIQPDVSLVLPTAVSPHKASGEIGFSHRYTMAKMALGLETVRFSGVENRGNKKRNYTIKTLKWLRKKYPGYEIYLVIGSDMLTSFTSWSRYHRIISMTTLVVASREEDDFELQEAISELRKQGAKILQITFEAIVISSSEIRQLIKLGKDTSLYIEKSVKDYIDRNNLYS